MTLPASHMKVLTLLLLLVQLCLPVSGALFISEHVGAGDVVETAPLCTHADAADDLDHQDDSGQMIHCHGLDEPCETASYPVLKHSPPASMLMSYYDGTLLPGHAVPIDIPPKYFV